VEDKKCLTNSIQYGIEGSRKLLENKHQSDIRWRMDNHNKEAGRLVSYYFIFSIKFQLVHNIWDEIKLPYGRRGLYGSRT